MHSRALLLASSLLVCTVAGFVSTASARGEDWQDKQGDKFRGDADEMIGPIALFRTSRTTCRKIPAHLLAPEDCVRFYEATKDKPARAEHWAEAKGDVTYDLREHVLRVRDGKLVRAELDGGPEPEFFVLVYVNNSIGDSWGMMDNALGAYNKVKARFPDLVAGVMFGLHNGYSEQENMAVSKNVPWLVADVRAESQMASMADVAPGDGYGLLLLSRNGRPLFGAANPDAKAVEKFFEEVSAFAELADPANPQTWGDRVYYERAVQPVRFAHGTSDPELIGNPLKAEGLRQREVYLIDAKLAVDAGGKVTSTTIEPGSIVPAPLVAPIANALTQACVFVPAVKDGKFVAGTYPFHMAIAH